MLYPVALLYGAVVSFRNWLYDKSFLKSVRFDFPVIGVGNLTVGGTGKSPHVEYLIRLLQYELKVAVLSRGYGRKSHGFVLANENSTALQIGDEPRQFKSKFPETIVAVGEDRVLALPKILFSEPETDVVLLDDSFQHRGIRPGLTILLTEYANLFVSDELLPIGGLREPAINYHRADIILVTKCPADLSDQQRTNVLGQIKPFKYQKVYFTTLQYAPLYSFYDSNQKLTSLAEVNVLLVCGIARHRDLQQYLQSIAQNVYVRDYRDHHRFDEFDLENIRDTFNNIGPVKKVIVTTEKDAARLETFRNWFLQNKIEIFVQPVSVSFLDNDAEKFNADILQYITTTKQKLQT